MLVCTSRVCSYSYSPAYMCTALCYNTDGEGKDFSVCDRLHLLHQPRTYDGGIAVFQVRHDVL